MRKLIALFLTLFAFAAVAGTPQKDIEHFIDRVVREVPEVPSLGVAVVRDGKPLYLREADTGYYIGSTTKAYTALACSILAAKGKLDLDAPLTKYLPEVKFAPPLDASKVTLRQLLSHTSRLRNDAVSFRTAFTGEHNPKMLLSLLNESTAGPEGFRYTNLGYIVASMVLERVTGKPWQKALDDIVFTPLGMTRTTAYMSEAQTWPIAIPHEVNRRNEVVVLDYRKNDSMMHAAGGIVTTPRDLARWLTANMLREGRGVPRAAFDEVLKEQAVNVSERGPFKSHHYGFGWWIGDFRGEPAYFHQGGFEGWQSIYSFLPQKKVAVGILTNASGPSVRVLTAVSGYIYDRLLEKPVDADAVLATIKSDMEKGRAAHLAEVEKITKRPWMLQHPNDAYTGRYENPAYGTLVIAKDGDKLVASLANLRSVIEAFTEPETARVELVPGSGEVLRFKFAGGEKPESVQWGDDVFRRVD